MILVKFPVEKVVPWQNQAQFPGEEGPKIDSESSEKIHIWIL